MRRDAEVAPKCVLKSLVIRKRRDSLERRLRPKRKKKTKKKKKKKKKKKMNKEE